MQPKFVKSFEEITEEARRSAEAAMQNMVHMVPMVENMLQTATDKAYRMLGILVKLPLLPQNQMHQWSQPYYWSLLAVVYHPDSVHFRMCSFHYEAATNVTLASPPVENVGSRY